MKNYNNFIFEQKQFNRWFNLKSLYNDNQIYTNNELEEILTLVKLTYCKDQENYKELTKENIRCVFLEISDEDIENDNIFKKISDDIITISGSSINNILTNKYIPGNKIKTDINAARNIGYYFGNIIKIDNVNYALYIPRNNCKSISATSHGVEYEKKIEGEINNKKFNLMKQGDKWDAVGKIPLEFFNERKKTHDVKYIKNGSTRNDLELSLFDQTLNWNIKYMKHNSSIELSDFLRISGYEKKIDDSGEITVKKIDNKINQFGFLVSFYKTDKKIPSEENFILVETSAWVNMLPTISGETYSKNTDVLAETLNDMYTELKGFKFDAKTIVEDFFGYNIKKLKITKGGTELIKKKEQEVLDDLLKNNTIEISIGSVDNMINHEITLKDGEIKNDKDKSYKEWRDNKDSEWNDYRDKYKNKEKENPKISLAFKRDHKGQLRIQGVMNQSTFTKLKKESDYIVITPK